MGKFLGAIKCSEFCRQWFIWICAILHVSLLIGAALLIVAALYVEFSFTEYLAIIGFKIGYTPLLLEAFGAVGVLVSFGGFFTLITSLYPDKRSSTNMILLGYTIGVWIPIAGHIFLLVTLTRDSKATSQQGLSYVETFAQNLNSYKDKLEIKATIDDMQQFFDCCGNEGYEDWFRIQWYPDDFLDPNSWEVKQHRTKQGSFLIQDVPFSCCDPTMKRPCIHHQVYDDKIHHNYDHRKDLTLYKEGCRKQLLLQYDTFMSKYVSIVVGAVLGIYVVIVIIVKYLQTSISGALAVGDPEVTAVGYIIQFKGDTKADEKLAKLADVKKLEAGEEEEEAKEEKDKEKEEEDDDEADENNANNTNESRNNGFFARLRRRISAMTGRRSEGDSSESSSSNSSSSSSSESSSSSSQSTSARSSTTDRRSQIAGTLPISPSKLTSDATRTPGSRSEGQTQSDVYVPESRSGRIVITGPRSELTNPKLLDVIRAIARLQATERALSRPGDTRIYRSNYSGNAGGLELVESSTSDTSSTSTASSRATTVRFAGSETTTYISDSGSSAATGQSTSGSGTGTSTVTGSRSGTPTRTTTTTHGSATGTTIGSPTGTTIGTTTDTTNGTTTGSTTGFTTATTGGTTSGGTISGTTSGTTTGSTISGTTSGTTTGGSTSGTTSGTTTGTATTTGDTTNSSGTGASSAGAKDITATSSGTGTNITDSKTGASSTTGVLGTDSKTGITVIGSGTSTSISESGSPSHITGAEGGTSPVAGLATASQFSGLSTEAVTTGSHLANNIEDPKYASQHSSVSSRKASKDHHKSLRHGRRSSHSTRDHLVDLQAPPSLFPHRPDHQRSSPRKDGSDGRSKKAAPFRRHVYDEVAPFSAATPSAVRLKAGHKRHSPKRKVKDDVLGNGEEPHIREHITESYHAYEEIPYHVYDEILGTPDGREIPAGGRVNSRLSVEFIPVGERIYEEIPYVDHESRNSSSPTRPAGQRLYEEIRFGDHVYKSHALSGRLAEEHAYEEIPLGHHRDSNRPLPTIPQEGHVYEEIPVGNHLYERRLLPNIPEEEHTYEEIPAGHYLYKKRSLPNIPEEEHIYEEILFRDNVYKNRPLEEGTSAHEISEVDDHATKTKPVEKSPDRGPVYEEIPFGGQVYGNVTTQSVQDQQGYLQPDRQRSRVAGHMDPKVQDQSGYLQPDRQRSRVAGHMDPKVQDQSGYLQPDRQRSRVAGHMDPKVPSQREPTEIYLRPNLRKTRSTELIHVHDQVAQSRQRDPRSNHELGSARNYSSPQTVQSGPTDAELQDRRHGTAVVSRNSGPVSPAAEPQTVPAYQGFAEEHHDTPQSVQSGPAYTGLKERRSEHTYAVVGLRPSQADTLSATKQPPTVASTPVYHELFGTGSGRPQIIPSEPIYMELQDRRPEHIYAAVGSPSSRSDVLSSDATSQRSPSQRSYEGVTGTGYNRPHMTQSEPAYMGLQDRGSAHAYTTITGQLVALPSQADTLPANIIGPPQTVRNEPVYQGPGETSRRELGRVDSRTHSEANRTGQAPNEQFYVNTVPQAPPTSTDVGQSHARSTARQNRHKRQGKVNVLPQSPESQPQYQQIRREDSSPSAQSQPEYLALIPVGKSPQYSFTAGASQDSSGLARNLLSTQPQLQQIRSENNGQSAHNQSAFQGPVQHVRKSSQDISTPITTQTSSGVPVSAISSQPQPQQASSQQEMIPGESKRHKRPLVPPKSSAVKQIAKQILSSGPENPISAQPQVKHVKTQQEAQQNAEETSLNGPDNPVLDHTRLEQSSSKSIRSGDVARRSRPVVPPKPAAVVQQTPEQTTSIDPSIQVLNKPKHQQSSHHQLTPEDLAIRQGIANQAGRRSSQHIDSPIDGQKPSSSGQAELQLPSSRGVRPGDEVNGSVVRHSSSRNHTGRSSPNLRFQGMPSEPSDARSDARERSPWDHRHRPLVPLKPTKAHQKDRHSSIKTKLEGIYAKATFSEPNNYRSALRSKRSVESSAATSKQQLMDPSRAEIVSHSTSQPSHERSSTSSQTLQSPAPTNPPPPPPPPPQSLKLPIRGILVRRHDSSSVYHSPSESVASTSDSVLKDTQLEDKLLAVRA